MALTRPRFGQLNTSIVAGSDPITVLHSGASSANVDVGFLMNRANGLVSNVALYWNESGNTFVTAFTSNTGVTDTNVTVTSYANVTTGSLLPGANVTYNLGSPTQRWKDLWLSGTTIYLGGAVISAPTSTAVTIANPSGGSFSVTGTAAGQASGAFGNISANSNIDSTTTTSGALQVVGGAGITANLNVGGIGTFNGNVAFNGQQVTHYDSIIDLHTYGNLLAWTTDDGKDIGLRFHYYKGADSIAFLGWENTTQTLQYLASATETNSNVTGTFGNVQFGSLLLSNTTPSTSTTTGALLVSGGVGVGGNLYVAGNLDVTGTTTFRNIETVTTTEYVQTQVATSVLASTIGNVGASVIGATGRFDTSVTTATVNAATIGNTGATLTGTLSTAAQPNVTSIGSLTGLSVAGETTVANITAGGITSNGTIQASTITAATIGNTGAVHTGSTLTLTSWANIAGPIVATTTTAVPALQITGTATKGGTGYHDFLSVTNQGGGTNINKWFRLDSTGNLQIFNSAYNTNIFNLTDGGTLAVPAISAGGSIGTNGQVLSSTGSGLQWVASGGFSGGSVPNQTTFASNIVAASGTTSTSTTTGALVVTGGIGVTKDSFFGANLTIVGNLTVQGNNLSISSATLNISDPIINLHSPSDLAPLTTDDGADIGIKIHYYKSGDKAAFLGWQNSTGYLEWYDSGSDSGNVFTGTTQGTIRTGALILANVSGTVLSVAGNTAITSTLYAQGIYDNGNRVLTNLSSSGAGNLTVSVSAPASTTVSLPATGPGATTVGSSTSIPVITTDAYGRITALTSQAVSTTISLAGTSGSGSVAGGGTLTFAGTYGVTATVSSSTITIGTSQDLRTTASPTFAAITGTISTASQTNITAVGNLTSLAISGTTSTRGGKNLITNFTGATAPANPQVGDEWYYTTSDILYKYLYDGTNYQWVDLTSPLYNASTSATASTLALRDSGGNLTATNFLGVASSAKYADLAEIYIPDQSYDPGTVVVFGGTEEITVTDRSHDPRVAGVISTNPAYLMNSECLGLPVAFTGRVPCRVQGPVTKGDLLVTSNKPGVAHAIDNTQFVPGCVIGKSLENITTDEIATIEVVVGRF